MDKTIEIIELYLKGDLQTEISKKYGLTRQRVSQIIIKYRKDNKISKIKKEKKYICKDCGKEFTNSTGYSHYRRCKKCVEKSKKLWSRKYKLNKCVRCKSSKYKHRARGLCCNCYLVYLYNNNSESKEKIKKTVSRWREKNLDKVKENQKKYYYKNQEKIKEYSRNYYANKRKKK